MNQVKAPTSLVDSGKKYPEVLEEIKGKSFEELISPPKNLSTAKDRFQLQRTLYIKLSDGDDITWEEAKLGIKPLPSISAPADLYKNLKIARMPEEIIAKAEKSRMFALSILNHPERIKILREAKKQEFKKPSLAHSRVLDRAEVEHRLLTFSDVAPVQPDLTSERLHRRKLLAQGPFIPTSRKKGVGVRLPLTTGSMTTGNPEMIAVSAMCGVLATTYKEGLCAFPEIQAEVTSAAVEIIHEAIAKDPLWKDRPDRKELLSFWLSQIGITVETDERQAVKRVKLLMPLIKKRRLSSLAVRIYNPQVSKETVNTVKRLKKEHVGKLMKNGRPFAPEGLGGFQKIDLGLASIPDNILDTIINFLIPPFVFQGTSSGRRFFSISDMHREADLEFLWELSEESRK